MEGRTEAPEWGGGNNFSGQMPVGITKRRFG